MGRKIPGRKHRGVKDPEKQRAERFAKIKDKINHAPSNPDEQQISKSLSRIIDLKNKVKEGLFSKKKKKRDKSKDGENKLKKFNGRPEKTIPKFERLPGESDREFKHRISRICSEVVKEAAYEDKYQVNIKRNEKGEVEAVEKRPKDELELLVKKLKKEKMLSKNKKGKKKKKAQEEENKPRLTKSQKWALKQKEKKKKKLLKKDEEFSFEPQREQVKFGDIVHAPPSLVAPKKVGKLEGAPRPGQKQLLLKSMFINNDENTSTIFKASNRNKESKIGLSKVTKTIDKKAKRKTLPHALRRQLDKQQKEIIESYKLLKSQKYTVSDL